MRLRRRPPAHFLRGIFAACCLRYVALFSKRPRKIGIEPGICGKIEEYLLVRLKKTEVVLLEKYQFSGKCGSTNFIIWEEINLYTYLYL